MAYETANSSSQRAATAQIIKFPKARKRGAKVKNGPIASILEFPLTALSIEEIIEQYVVATARHNPQLYPGGLPRDGEDNSHRLVYDAVPRMRSFLRDKWIADTKEMNADLARGITSQGDMTDPEVQKKVYERCVRNYGPPEEGYFAWAPLLRKIAAQQAAGVSNGASS